MIAVLQIILILFDISPKIVTWGEEGWYQYSWTVPSGRLGAISQQQPPNERFGLVVRSVQPAQPMVLRRTQNRFWGTATLRSAPFFTDGMGAGTLCAFIWQLWCASGMTFFYSRYITLRCTRTKNDFLDWKSGIWELFKGSHGYFIMSVQLHSIALPFMAIFYLQYVFYSKVQKIVGTDWAKVLSVSAKWNDFTRYFKVCFGPTFYKYMILTKY